jgi:heme exporter protein C
VKVPRAATLLRILVPLTVISVLAAVVLNARAPTEISERMVQRIMYVHVPAAWVAYLSFFVAAFASAGFLWNKKRSWDRVAFANAEVGLVFCTLVLLTGPIWGKAIWNVWWQWDARLTTTLILWFMYVGYMVVRSLAEDREQGARWSAVVSILAVLDIYIIHESVQWWETLHPKPKVATTNGFATGLDDPQMRLAFFSGLLAFTILYLLLVTLRTRIETVSDAVDGATLES